MTTTKVLGITAAVTIGGVDYQLSKITFKIDQEKIEYVYMGGGGWGTQIPGGVKKASGNFEFAVDTTTQGGTYVDPFTDSLVTFAIPVGSRSLSFSAVISDMEVEKNATGLIMGKGNYASSGAVTYS